MAGLGVDTVQEEIIYPCVISRVAYDCSCLEGSLVHINAAGVVKKIDKITNVT